MSRNLLAAVTLYVACGILAFGHSAAKPCPPKSTFCATDTQILGGLFAGIFWPLYWSKEAWS